MASPEQVALTAEEQRAFWGIALAEADRETASQISRSMSNVWRPQSRYVRDEFHRRVRLMWRVVG